MQAELTESVQQSIRPGEMVDTYYYGETNMEKQAYPCVTNTRFVQQFSNNGAGSSQFVISPNQGVSDIVIALTLAAVTGTTTNVALPNGWGYSLVNRVSVRYGSSAQYFWSGQQMLLQNLYDAENSDKRDQILALGGSATTTASSPSIAAGGQVAYLYLKLPHNSIRAEGKPLPFPSDLLVQPIVVTVELFAPVAAYFLGTGAVSTGIPAQLASASLQVKQEMLTDSSDLLARRVDMNQNAYCFPLPYFAQQEILVPIVGTGAQSINLTGFRAGEVRSVLLWLTQNADQGVGAIPGNPGPLFTYGLNALTLNYNGEVFTRYDQGSSAIWALSGDTKTAQVNSTKLNAADPTTGAVSISNPWVEAPFAQINMAYDKEIKLMHGKPILNAVVNLTFTPGTGPNNAAWSGAGGVLHAMYIYNASLLCSRGSAEYVF